MLLLKARLAILKTEIMPIYEYQCADCEKAFEELVAVNDDRDAVVCPSCEGHNTRRLLSMFAGHTGAAKATSSGHSCGSPSCCRVPSR
jgi:putative FmdB family regulatory protein